jgi:hypothetical protein
MGFPGQSAEDFQSAAAPRFGNPLVPAVHAVPFDMLAPSGKYPDKLSHISQIAGRR